MDGKRDLLRHAVATLAYRGGKALRDAPPGFEAFRPAAGSRSAGEILAHIGDLLDWGVALAEGRKDWRDSTPSADWSVDLDRFFAGLARFDARLAGTEPMAVSEEELFRGPVADAFTHVGQIAMLRRLAGSQVRGENYLRAEIITGRVGREQSKPRREFD